MTEYDNGQQLSVLSSNGGMVMFSLTLTVLQLPAQECWRYVKNSESFDKQKTCTPGGRGGRVVQSPY